jgi:gamma-glutamyltranspeptidase/glutathione hydrolase
MNVRALNVRALIAGVIALAVVTLSAESTPTRTKSGMVVSQNETASRIGAEILRDGGSAIDAAVATAFALAVTHPAAGNVGGGGFIVFRPVNGDPVAYDFREMAPAKASPTMFLQGGKYSTQVHHDSYLAVGIPGTVAGLHLAWQRHGKLPWKRLVNPAIALARDGFVVTDGLSRSLKGVLPRMKDFPASIAQFTKRGVPYEAGDLLRLPDLARTLQRIAERGPAGFYEGETARLIEKDMAAHGGLITRDDLKAYQAKIRTPLRGTYHDLEVIAIPPPSSGGTVLIEMLNILEDYDLRSMGFGSAASLHLIAESMRRGFADRARYLGDPDFNPLMPIARLTSKAYAAALRKTIQKDHASKSSPTSFEWPGESDETTHISVVDRDRNAAAMTFTLEDGYGVKAVVAGAGFLLNNEMGDFNAGPGLTTADGLVGTEPNLAAPHKRMLSSMTPTILTRNGQLFMVTGSPGGRTIINTVLLTILNVVDFGMNAQGAVDAARIHHQWLPDRIQYERNGVSPDTIALLTAMGHATTAIGSQGAAQVIVLNQKEDVLEGGCDRRAADGAAVAQPVR